MQKLLVVAKAAPSKARSIVTAALSYLSELSIPSIATAVAGVAAPIIAGVLGDNFSAAILAPYLVLVGGAAVALDRILSGQPAPTPAPEPAPAPAPTSAKAPRKASGK